MYNICILVHHNPLLSNFRGESWSFGGCLDQSVFYQWFEGHRSSAWPWFLDLILPIASSLVASVMESCLLGVGAIVVFSKDWHRSTYVSWMTSMLSELLLEVESRVTSLSSWGWCQLIGLVVVDQFLFWNQGTGVGVLGRRCHWSSSQDSSSWGTGGK